MNKGQKTRDTILSEATYIASIIGLEALTLGKLASAVEMSKSGLFAHFKNKEKLQMDVLKDVTKKFVEKVIKPSMKVSNGEPRISEIAKNWIAWTNAKFMPGGCLFVTATIEYDDRLGPTRDLIVKNQKLWINFISDVARQAINEGHFHKNLDTELFAFEFQSIFQSYHYASRLLIDPKAEKRAWIMLDKLLEQSRV